MKRILSLTLVLVMVLSMIPMASAADGEWVGGYPHNHTEAKNPTVTQATCTTAKTTVYKCSGYGGTCSATKTVTEGEPLGHNAPYGTKACKDYNCTRCYTSVTADTPHTFNSDAACESRMCTVCYTTVAGSHTPGDAATCTTPQLCKVCEDELVAALGHDETGPAATCTTDQVCARANCDHVIAERTGHKYTGSKLSLANCSQPATYYPVCEDCETPDYANGTVATGPSAAAATGQHDYDANGKCKNKKHDGTTCGAAEIEYTLDMPSSKTIKVNQSVSVEATLSEGNSNATITYKSSNDDIAEVAADGTVTGMAIGEATITAKAIINDVVVATATSKITVTSGAYIDCDNVSVAVGSTATLSPTVKDLPTGYTDLTYSLEASSSSVFTLNESTMKVTGKAQGVGTVIISGYYKINSVKIDLDPVTVHIGVYDDHTIDVVLKDTISSTFKFTDEKIFSSAKYDGKAMSADSTLKYLLSEDKAYKIDFTESYISDNIGTLTTDTGWGTNDEVLIANLGRTAITLNGKSGTMVLKYTITTNSTYGNVIIATGTLSIQTSGTVADISYTTGFNGKVTVDEDDFNSFFKAAKLTGDLDYVMFDISSTTPDEGYLYTKVPTITTQDLATAKMHFNYKYNSTTDKNSNDYDLDTMTYLPNKLATKAYVDTVAFTCYSTTGATVSGILEFVVTQSNPFTDVKESDYFYDAVMWAVEEGVTTGQTETTFAPNAACTRAQVVTFMWRAAGEPTPKTTVNPFTDVKSSQYYYKAVLWAVEKGITTGLTATTFGPDAACTRAQVVTFLHRAAGEPSVTGFNSFTDVASTAYYYNPVLWAVKNDITNGMSATTFGSNSTCTRGQIVTFLYRYVVE